MKLNRTDIAVFFIGMVIGFIITPITSTSQKNTPVDTNAVEAYENGYHAAMRTMEDCLNNR